MFKNKWVRIMAEHGSDGVWHQEGGAADVTDLPISDALRQRLWAWNSENGKLADPILTERMGQEPFNLVAFSAEGWAIANAIKAEAPDWTVEYFDEVKEIWLIASLAAEQSDITAADWEAVSARLRSQYPPATGPASWPAWLLLMVFRRLMTSGASQVYPYRPTRSPADASRGNPEGALNQPLKAPVQRKGLFVWGLK